MPFYSFLEKPIVPFWGKNTVIHFIPCFKLYWPISYFFLYKHAKEKTSTFITSSIRNEKQLRKYSL